jgi:hypothetical protein
MAVKFEKSKMKINKKKLKNIYYKLRKRGLRGR